jgi:hypothetical protein
MERLQRIDVQDINATQSWLQNLAVYLESKNE